MKHSNLGRVNLNKVRKKVKKSKKKTQERRSPLIIVDEGEDIIFNMNFDSGVWKGVRTSEMATDHDGRKILRWVLRKDFNEDAQEIIESQLTEVTFL